MPPNGLRYPQVGGRGQSSADGKLLRCRNCLKIAQNPTCRVHAVLGGIGCEQIVNHQSASDLPLCSYREFQKYVKYNEPNDQFAKEQG